MWHKNWFDAGLYFEKDGGDGGDGGGNGDGAGKKPDDKTTPDTKFTQADLDRVAGEARKSGREVGVNDLLKELGFTKADDLKTLLADAKKRAEAEKSDLEKAQSEAADWKKKAEEALNDSKTTAEKAQETLMRAAVLAEASKPEYRIKADALPDVWAFIKRESIKPKDGADGEFTGIGEALKALAKAKPYLVETGDGRGTPRSTPRKPGDQSQQRQPERIIKTL